jgi:hypothetical protein
MATPKETLNNLSLVIASAVAFSHEAEGRGGKQSRMPAQSNELWIATALGPRDDGINQRLPNN